MRNVSNAIKKFCLALCKHMLQGSMCGFLSCGETVAILLIKESLKLFRLSTSEFYQRRGKKENREYTENNIKEKKTGPCPEKRSVINPVPFVKKYRIDRISFAGMICKIENNLVLCRRDSGDKAPL
ncbi:MAG: hypothetical protein JSS32_10005 [Verrucomicrobia bacterium]|nr:hypothetical protein [Verrucomicrobiota bacterium]